jgi:hypothetical protein
MNDIIKEGDLYREVVVAGQRFSIRYGYYEEYERYSRYNEPVPLYPDFTKQPLYTAEGYPFATEMQDICKEYRGRTGSDRCARCTFFEKGDEMIGVCRCEERRHKNRG